jgi:hypothetical protein
MSCWQSLTTNGVLLTGAGWLECVLTVASS